MRKEGLENLKFTGYFYDGEMMSNQKLELIVSEQSLLRDTEKKKLWTAMISLILTGYLEERSSGK